MPRTPDPITDILASIDDARLTAAQRKLKRDLMASVAATGTGGDRSSELNARFAAIMAARMNGEVSPYPVEGFVRLVPSMEAFEHALDASCAVPENKPAEDPFIKHNSMTEPTPTDPPAKPRSTLDDGERRRLPERTYMRLDALVRAATEGDEDETHDPDA